MLRTAKWLLEPSTFMPRTNVTCDWYGRRGSVTRLIAERFPGFGQKKEGSEPFIIGNRIRRWGAPAAWASASRAYLRRGRTAAPAPRRLRSVRRSIELWLLMAVLSGRSPHGV